MFTKAPNKRVTIIHNARIATEGAPESAARANDSYRAFDGKVGWMGSISQGRKDMSALESEAASLDAEFYFPLRLKEIFPQLRRGRPEEVFGKQCEVLNGSGPGRPAVRMYFDTKSGLLVRQIRYTDTPLGSLPTQIDYTDYRTIGSAKIPYRTLSRSGGTQFTIQINDASENTLVDDSKFVQPAVEVK